MRVIGGQPLRVGERVRVREGPFAGLVGTLTEVTAEIAVVALKVLDSQVEVEMSPDWTIAAPKRQPNSRVESLREPRRDSA